MSGNGLFRAAAEGGANQREVHTASAPRSNRIACIAGSVRKRPAQVVGPDHEGEQTRPKAKFRIADREEPRCEPQTTDADRCLAFHFKFPDRILPIAAGALVHMLGVREVAADACCIGPTTEFSNRARWK
jgi:hypothetical protein